MIELGPIVSPLDEAETPPRAWPLVVRLLAILFVIALAAGFFFDLRTARAQDDTTQRAIEDVLVEHLSLDFIRADGSRTYVVHCRAAHGGCGARARRMAALFVRAGTAHHLDPWLLVALAIRESGANPDAVGARGELGLLQLHPESRAGRLATRLCAESPGECPWILVDAASRVLRASIDRCGDEGRGLVRYHGGRCGEPDAYARSVLARRDRLRGSS